MITDGCPICGALNSDEIPSSILTGNTFFIRGGWGSDEWRKVCGKCADERLRFHFGEWVAT